VQPKIAEAEQRIEEARRTRAESLDLGDLALSELPAGLRELSDLRRLYLGMARPTATGGVEWDEDRESPELTDLSLLAVLQGLQSLDVSGTAVTDLGSLAGLRGLQSLNLTNTGVPDLAPLEALQGLQSLYLFNCTGVTDLAPLEALQGLQSLNLSYCTGVTDLAPLEALQGLQSLYLSSTGVTDLAPLEALQGLQSLDLSYCKGLTDLAPLEALQRLQKLNLYGCRPVVPANLLRVFAYSPRMTELVADQAVGVPREVLSHNPDDNCRLRLRAHLSELGLGAEAENEVKVILLGNGRVGKTQLCRRFRGQPFDQSVESTHGVQIWREELRIQTGGQEQVFQVNWWDFGGQDIYHGTHALFLRSRAVFLILWTPQLENRVEYLESGIPLRNQPLAYWLDYVRSLAGEDSPVIVVQSQCDRFADRRPSPMRQDGFGFFESCSYSAREDFGREALEAHLRDAIRYLLERNGALEIGRGRAEVRRRLYDWKSKDQKRKPEKRRYRTLTTEEFRVLCDKVGGIVSWEHALDYLHHTGVVFYDPNLFSKRIVLDQDWALDAVYAVFHRGRAVPWLRDSGRFTREDLAELVWQKHSPEEQRLFLGLMESCGVCFSCGKTDQGEIRYIAPDLLPKYEAIVSRLHAWKEEPGTPVLRLEYHFFHQGVIRGLMSQVGRQAGDLAEYWKYGLWFKDGRRDTQLLVQFEDTSTDEAPGKGVLELKAQGRDPLGLLREIRKAVLGRRIGEKPDELLTLNGTTVARRALDSVIDGHVLDLQRKPTPAADFVAFFTDREHASDEAHATGEPQEIAITPLPLDESEKPREVFISYAWGGDGTPEGQIREDTVDFLCEALRGDGFQPVRDREQMRSGDLISAFIRRLTRADFVVAVISDKYLRSTYCMHEIYKIWQRCQGDANDMAERVVPIVLPEVKIGNVRERLPYLEYWADQADSLEALVRKPNLRPSRESWEEVRLVREFAHHVDDILVFLNDVLMPRKLEANLDGGFQDVRDALRRRMGVGG
jgi:internalin A